MRGYLHMLMVFTLPLWSGIQLQPIFQQMERKHDYDDQHQYNYEGGIGNASNKEDDEKALTLAIICAIASISSALLCFAVSAVYHIGICKTKYGEKLISAFDQFSIMVFMTFNNAPLFIIALPKVIGYGILCYLMICCIGVWIFAVLPLLCQKVHLTTIDEQQQQQQHEHDESELKRCRVFFYVVVCALVLPLTLYFAYNNFKSSLHLKLFCLSLLIALLGGLVYGFKLQPKCAFSEKVFGYHEYFHLSTCISYYVICYLNSLLFSLYLRGKE